MNKYIEEAINNSSKGLPKTYEEFSRLSHAEARLVPATHIERLRNEFALRSNKYYNSGKKTRPLNFDWEAAEKRKNRRR